MVGKESVSKIAKSTRSASRPISVNIGGFRGRRAGAGPRSELRTLGKRRTTPRGGCRYDDDPLSIPSPVRRSWLRLPRLAAGATGGHLEQHSRREACKVRNFLPPRFEVRKSGFLNQIGIIDEQEPRRLVAVALRHRPICSVERGCSQSRIDVAS